MPYLRWGIIKVIFGIVKLAYYHDKIREVIKSISQGGFPRRQSLSSRKSSQKTIDLNANPKGTF